MPIQILVIEDVMQIRENIADLLTISGYQVRMAVDGKAGIVLAREWQPDLILCDIMMENMDGYQVLETIRTSPDMANIPFVFLTAKADWVDVRRGMSLGADDYLPKPFQASDLLDAIESRLRRSQQQDQPSINPETNFLTTIQGHDQQGNRLLRIQDCLYFFIQQRAYFVAHPLGNFQINKTIDKLVLELDPNQFFRINRHLIIHRKSVESYAYWDKGKYYLVLTNNMLRQEAILPKARFGAFKRWLRN